MKKDVLFTLPAEALDGANKICVLGDFNDWTPGKDFELKIQPDGSASATVLLEAGKAYKYRFLINDETWVNDYHAESYERDTKYPIDNCIITVPLNSETTAPQTEKKATTEVSLTSETVMEEVSVKKEKKRSSSASRKADSKTTDKKKSTKSVSAKTKSATSSSKTKKSSAASSTKSLSKKRENPGA